jgi:hypothetical protein
VTEITPRWAALQDMLQPKGCAQLALRPRQRAAVLQTAQEPGVHDLCCDQHAQLSYQHAAVAPDHHSCNS